jgi:hypothetical protein
MLARNEDWCLGLSLRAALLICDGVIFTDHGSTDRTREIVDEVRDETGKPIDYLRVDAEWWDEMPVRHEMLERGRRLGGKSFVIVDADEALTANLLPLAPKLIRECPPRTCLALPMVATYHSVWKRRVDGVWGYRSRLSWCFNDDGSLSWAPDGGYQHHMRVPRGCDPRAPYAAGAWHREDGPVDLGFGGVFHLQFVTRERLAAKSVYYKVMETIRWPGRMSADELNKKYDWTLSEAFGPDIGAPEFHPIPEHWWKGYQDLGWLRYLDVNRSPWQAEEARRLYAANPPGMFGGLEFHGVIQR